MNMGVGMSRRVVTSRDLRLLGMPTKEQTLALVGWLAMCNVFGKVTTDEVELRCESLPLEATRWIGAITAVAGRGHRNMTASRQTAISNGKRKVAARRSRSGLTT